MAGESGLAEPTSDWGRGAWMQTFAGHQFFPLAPRVEDVDPVDIAHALSLTCRYGGHVKRFYSVAEHTIRISWWLQNQGEPWDVQLAGLLHDAAEAYIGDMVRPLKHHMPDYQAIDVAVSRVVFERFGCPVEYAAALPAKVREADNRILLDERNQLLSTPPGAWEQDGLNPLGIVLDCWSPPVAELAWAQRLDQLTSGGAV